MKKQKPHLYCLPVDTSSMLSREYLDQSISSMKELLSASQIFGEAGTPKSAAVLKLCREQGLEVVEVKMPVKKPPPRLHAPYVVNSADARLRGSIMNHHIETLTICASGVDVTSDECIAYVKELMSRELDVIACSKIHEIDGKLCFIVTVCS